MAAFPLSALTQPIEQDAFVARARAATEKYHRLEEAIADGFRRVGPDMPHMGEHWIRIRHVLRRSIRPEEPTVLTYLRIDGDPVLTGAAYTAPVLPGDSEPPSPVEGAEWHYHTGSIQEEVMGHDHGESGPRLGMIHAWIWSGNPDGLFTADNWGLPFVRLGLSPPAEVDPFAAKALFLLSGGVDYYGDLIAAATGAQQPQVGRLLDEYRERVSSIVPLFASNQAAGGEPNALVPGSIPVDQLHALWHELWVEMRAHVDDNMIELLGTGSH